MAQEMTRSTLRSDPIFASLSQFFHTFQAAFRPWPNPVEPHLSKSTDDDDYIFATEDLENMLLDPSLRYQLEELILRLLRFLTRNRYISPTTWQEYFAKEWDRREPEQENPFRMTTETPLSFFDLPMETRLNLLNALCEWQLDDPERLREHVDTEEDPTQWRVDPIGYDAKGNRFWLFDDNRLYKESAPKKRTPKRKPAARPSSRRSSRRITKPEQEKKQEELEEEEEEEEWTPWKLVCLTVTDWQQFPEKYANSAHPENQNFYHMLVDDVLPKVIPVIEEHEKNRKKQEALVYRKRSSRILVRDLEAMMEQKQEVEEDGLSRIEKQRMEKERREKERQSKAREERLMERERRLEAQHMETQVEKSRQEKENKTWKVQGSQEFKIVLKLGDTKKPLKRKRGRKPKYPKEQDEEFWTFNCSCGVFGKNIDDGTPMIACEKCNEWQHIDCLRRSGQVESNLSSFEDYAFICQRCKDQEKEKRMTPSYTLPSSANHPNSSIDPHLLQPPQEPSMPFIDHTIKVAPPPLVNLPNHLVSPQNTLEPASSHPSAQEQQHPH